MEIEEAERECVDAVKAGDEKRVAVARECLLKCEAEQREKRTAAVVLQCADFFGEECAKAVGEVLEKYR